MNKWIPVSGLLLAAALTATACGGGKSDNAAPAASAAASAASSGAARTITVNAKNFEFDQKEIKVKKGDSVTIALNNSQGNHGLKIEGYDVEVKGGKSVTFTADKAGEFNFSCSIMCGAGHAEMTGKLIVE
ncbi:cupredoxin domain-containing protein [Cohnella caldifontis]|uniref:cupredoxin domain-containing protein n=1 Tax=Cohnella caldifontis TaxID=3027471 RepID=UPI0023EBC4BB|nr:cupredoxin domain-containing protein [Cohnella sp. YIM B05605]